MDIVRAREIVKTFLCPFFLGQPERRIHRKHHGRRDGKRKYLLTGMVFCGLCGHRYCGDSMQTGKDRKVVGTYACNNRNNHGARICRNQNVRQQPLEELVLRKIEETVFDKSRIPEIVRA